MKKKTIYLVILLLLNIIFIRTANADTYKADYLSVNNLKPGYTSNGTWILYNNYTPPRNQVDDFDFDLNQELYDNQNADYFIFNIQNFVNQYDDLDGSGYLRCSSSGGGVCDIYRITYDKISVDITLQYHPKNANGRWGPVGKCEFIQIGENISTVKCPNVSKGTDYTHAIFTFGIFYDTQMATNWYMNLGISREYNSVISTESTIVQKQNETNKKLEESNQKQQETNNKLDEIKNTDISNDSKEQPNTKEYNDYQDAENGLFDKMEHADTSNLNVAIDGNSANFVWDTITRFYNSNALLMNFLISILSIGIIKMALGR